MTIKIEGLHTGEFIQSEASGERSREEITIASGENLKVGDVIAQTKTGGTITAAADAGNTGDGTVTGLSVGSGAQEGEYRLVCIEPAVDAGTFQVEDPDGSIIGTAVVAVAFAGDIGLTINDGAADFIAGDSFTLTVTQTTGEWQVLAPAATDGSEVAAGVLYADVDATAAATAGVVIARDAEVNGKLIGWPGGITAAEKDLAITQLNERGIIFR